MTTNTLICLTVLGAFSLAACASDATKESAVNTSKTSASDTLALDGNDPLSYREGAPQQGRADLELTWQGQRYRFASADNRARFERDPERHAPQYGGHCSLAMSLGEVAPASPTSWSVDDGKLYFHNSAITAFLFKYLPGRTRAADQRWSTLSSTASTTATEATDGKASL